MPVHTEYRCDTCQKCFKQKSQYDSHRDRKRPCKAPAPTEAPAAAAGTAAGTAAPAPVSAPSYNLTGVPTPPLKWVGGKTQILPEVLRRFPATIASYHEPFLGGGSVLLGLLWLRKKGAIRVEGTVYASDLNPTLVGFYQHLQARPAELVAALEGLVTEFRGITGTVVHRKPETAEDARTSQESYYYWVRSRFNGLEGEARSSVGAAAMFLFLNKTCFRGLYREGPHGFNVPFGHYNNPTVFMREELLALSELLAGVVFKVQDFAAALGAVGAGDFVYLDPPYAPEKEDSFVDYTSEGFDLAQHHTLFKATKGLGERGARFLMSNSDAGLVKAAFKADEGFETAVIVCRRAIHSKAPGTTVNEVLVRRVEV